jgi:hypothetical protein
VPDAGPVDTSAAVTHRGGVEKKPRKVEEKTGAYAVKKPAQSKSSPQTGPRYADLEKVRISNAQLMRVHQKVLQKLAQ